MRREFFFEKKGFFIQKMEKVYKKAENLNQKLLVTHVFKFGVGKNQFGSEIKETYLT